MSIILDIKEGRNIHIEMPTYGMPAENTASAALGRADVSNGDTAGEQSEEYSQDRVRRTLKNYAFPVKDVKIGDKTSFDNGVLVVRKSLIQEALACNELIADVNMDVITPDHQDVYVNTMMDVQPIAVKKEGELGEGSTFEMTGVYMLLTGTDEDGLQTAEANVSNGIYEDNVWWGRPGAPEKGEIFIKTEVVIKEGTNMERPGPLAAHTATDVITQEIRLALKKLDDTLVVDTETFEQVRRPGKKKVVIVKEIMGQGAMHDNLILPVEPVGVLGAKPNVDLGNVPVMVSPLEVLDGCIHALTCIGPASKEMSRHYWREPLVLETLYDKELDLCGVIFVGSPQINSEKFYVSKRVGMMCEALDVDGAFVTTEGFGNNHIDFACHIEQIGMRGISVVGMSFCAVQGALVVGNKYMTNMVDNNKSESGIENEVLACNTLCHEDAIRALYMLKADMAGEEIKKPEKKWNPNVKENNVELISNVTGKPVELVANEQSLPMSQKRKEKYD